MPRSHDLRPGCAYSFQYPRYNYDGLPARTECRRVIVQSIRDVRREPLDPTTVSLNPSLRRGRWLVTGRDLDRDATRSFYVDSMTQVQPLPEDQYKPIRNSGYVVLSSFGQSMFQASRLNEAIAYLLGRRTGVLCKVLGVGPEHQGAQESS